MFLWDPAKLIGQGLYPDLARGLAVGLGLRTEGRNTVAGVGGN